jgi:tight adherence protein C
VAIDPRVLIALCAGLGSAFLVAAVVRWQQRGRMQKRLRTLGLELAPAGDEAPNVHAASRSPSARDLAGRLGARVATRLPSQAERLGARVDRAGLAGELTGPELLGWKVLGLAIGIGGGLLAIAGLGGVGFLLLIAGVIVGWFGIDIVLARYHTRRRRQILRDLPTVMDLLVLSLEAGMGLDRALRTVIAEYRSALADELHRVLNDIDLGLSRGEAFERLGARVGLDDLRSLSRAIVQSEELGVSLVGVMQGQSREVRLSRRRAAEAEALQAPIKMLIPLVIFILPTLFMLLLGPVLLRTGAALSGVGP